MMDNEDFTNALRHAIEGNETISNGIVQCASRAIRVELTLIISSITTVKMV